MLLFLSYFLSFYLSVSFSFCLPQYLVLDEAQAIKNNLSLRWNALLRLSCRNRLLLTGTPIQNRSGSGFEAGTKTAGRERRIDSDGERNDERKSRNRNRKRRNFIFAFFFLSLPEFEVVGNNARQSLASENPEGSFSVTAFIFRDQRWSWNCYWTPPMRTSSK